MNEQPRDPSWLNPNLQALAAPPEQVDHPAHYGGADDPFEHIKVMEGILTPEEFSGAMNFQVTKYLRRYKAKGGLVDLRKAKWYLDRWINYAEQP